VEIQRDILIVDDDKQVREVLHQIFLTAGYNCRLAQDGREGVAMFKAVRPPLTVTDLKMPNMGGIELLQQVRDVDQDCAVIVLTGAADVKTAIESLKLGAYDFIMKPVNVDELLIAADRALERRQLLMERRQYQVMLEHRVEEATHHLAAAYRELESTYHATWRRWAPPSTRVTSAPSRTRGACTATRWPPRASTASPRPR
jgi:DNA-binding NtrC family response regulator